MAFFVKKAYWLLLFDMLQYTDVLGNPDVHVGLCECGDTTAQAHEYVDGLCKCGSIEPSDDDDGDCSGRY